MESVDQAAARLFGADAEALARCDVPLGADQYIGYLVLTRGPDGLHLFSRDQDKRFTAQAMEPQLSRVVRWPWGGLRLDRRGEDLPLRVKDRKTADRFGRHLSEHDVRVERWGWPRTAGYGCVLLVTVMLDVALVEVVFAATAASLAALIAWLAG